MVTVQIVAPRVRLAGDPILGELEHRIIALLCAGGKQAKVVRGGVSEIQYGGDLSLLDPRKPLGDGKDSILAGCGGTWMAGTSPAMTSAWYPNPEPPGRGDYEPAKAVR